MTTDSQIREFWSWFASIADELAADLDNRAILTKLDEKILAFNDLCWEVGPGLRKPVALAISPGGDKDLLSTTRRLIEAAPVLEQWEFHPAKPPKEWDLQFTMHCPGGPMDVDARTWEYVLCEFPDGLFDILLKADGLQGDEDTRYQAARIVIEGQIGEQALLEWVNTIELVEAFDGRFANRESSIRHLRQHLRSIGHDI